MLRIFISHDDKKPDFSITNFPQEVVAPAPIVRNTRKRKAPVWWEPPMKEKRGKK